jgi:methylmalonyl-CoA mutase
VIVGVNKYRLKEEVQNFDVLKIDNSEVRNSQIRRIEAARKSRDNAKCEAALKALEECARTGKGNLLALSVECAKLRATVGEISMAMENVWGRHVAKDQIVRGAYSSESMDKTNEKGKQEYE